MQCVRRIWFVLILALCGPLSAELSGQPAGVPADTPKKELIVLYTEAPIVVDGVLDESVWQEAQVSAGFVQREPHEGAPGTERTEVRALYNKQAVYFGLSAYDSEPDKLIVNYLEQDFQHPNDDIMAICLDTFDDDRNGYCFYVNPAGAMKEIQFVDEARDSNVAWEDVWDAKARVTPEGYFIEVRIPFKSLRFPRSETQEWGINFLRRIRRKSEQLDWSAMPRRFTHTNVSFAGALKGLEGVEPGRNFKLKPFATGQLSRLAADDLDATGDVGLDVKYGLTTGLTLDATLNTDFSQAEADEQQLNLTRFNLFFPEKRDFFLENAGIFLFGQTDDRVAAREKEIIPFFSRTIGLSPAGQPLPILGGARVTGRLGPYSLGLLDMQTRDSDLAPANNFAVVRLKRNILERSTVGGLWVQRKGEGAGDTNRTFGLDANFSFARKLNISSFLAGTRTPGLQNEDGAGRLWAEWKTNFWEARSGYLNIGRNFNAELGFVPRVGMRKSNAALGFRPRPKNPWLREFFPNAQIQYITDPHNRLLTRQTQLEMTGEFHSGANFSFGRSLSFERLDESFRVRRLLVAPGDYHFDYWYASYNSNPSRSLSGNAAYEWGSFWNGHRKGLRLSTTYHPHYKLGLTARYNWDKLEFGSTASNSHLVTLRANYSFSMKMFLYALVQYNSDAREVSTNLRFNLIHRPLSDIFVVYNEQRDTFTGGVVDKVLSVKYTHMLDF